MEKFKLSHPITTSGPPLHCFPIINTLCGPNLNVMLLLLLMMEKTLNIVMNFKINLCICIVFMGLFMIRSRGRRWMKTRRTHGDIEWVCNISILHLISIFGLQYINPSTVSEKFKYGAYAVMQYINPSTISKI